MNRKLLLDMAVSMLLVAGLVVTAYGGEGVEEQRELGLNQRQPPLKVMDAIGLKPGMTIADIGAGQGRYTVWFSPRVGPHGMVYSNDIDPSALDHLRQRCKEQGLTNVKIVLGEVTDPELPAGAIDIAFMINVYHHLDKPVKLIRDTLACLAPGGVVAIVECDPNKDGFNPDHGTPRRTVLRQLEEAGLVEIEVIDPDWLKDDYIYIGRPAGVAPAAGD